MPIAKPIIWKTQLTLALLIAIPVALSAVRLMWFANGADPMAETMDTSHFANIPIRQPVLPHCNRAIAPRVAHGVPQSP
jgi:hypothetical protein